MSDSKFSFLNVNFIFILIALSCNTAIFSQNLSDVKEVMGGGGYKHNLERVEVIDNSLILVYDVNVLTLQGIRTMFGGTGSDAIYNFMVHEVMTRTKRLFNEYQHISRVEYLAEWAAVERDEYGNVVKSWKDEVCKIVFSRERFNKLNWQYVRNVWWNNPTVTKNFTNYFDIFWYNDDILDAPR